MNVLKLLTGMLVLSFLAAGTVSAQGLTDKEPPRGQLGAPVYPGAVFIRVVSELDPYHATAEFITRDGLDTVLAFFERKLPDRRQVTYEDKDMYLVAFLMKTWSKISGSPTRDELALLEKEPNLQIRTFDSSRYGTLIEYFSRKPEGKEKAAALENGNTMIRYTYRIEESDSIARMAVGTWRNVDRPLKDFYGTVLELRPNGSYFLILSADNPKPAASGEKAESGTYVIMNNTISLETKSPVRGAARKSGVLKVGKASLSLEIVGLPRLTFIRDRKPGGMPGDGRPRPQGEKHGRSQNR